MGFFGNLDNVNNSFTQDTLTRGLSQLLPVRVISIDQSNSLNNGTIVGEVILQQAQQPYKSRISASPINSNTKNYPLVNEVVFVIAGPSGKYSSNSSEVKYYYLTTLNLWNNVNTNPTPNPYTNITPNSQNKTIAEIEAGSTNKSGKVDTNSFKPGTYFVEKSNIFPLYPFEGDYIIEGRFGNSLRFGSTNIKYNSKYKTEAKFKSFSTNQLFALGDTKLSGKFTSDLSVINSQVRQFTEQYSDVSVSILVEGGESQVTNPNNIPIGRLALQRAQRVKDILPTYLYLNGVVRIDTTIGNTSYTKGVNNPNDEVYLNEQFVKISISVSGTEYILQDSNPQSLNNWSTTPEVGDPITILRNGQSNLLSGSAQSTTVEDINNDISSIWLTSTQQLPIEVSSQNDYLSYGEEKPQSPNEYIGSQIVLNSGRLLFNSTQDHILFSSQKSINLNSLEGINIDTVGPVVVEAPEIKLGSIDAEESVLLGDSTVDLLQNLISDLSSLTKIMGSQIGNNGILLEPTATTARTISNNLDTYQTQLDSLKSNIVKVE